MIEELYQQNAGLLAKAAQKFRGLDDLEDLRQEAFFSLLAAVDGYDSDKGQFSTYLFKTTVRGLRRYLDDNETAIRLPAWMRAQLARLDQIRKDFARDFGREPTRQDLRRIMKLEPAQLEAVLKAERQTAPKSTEEETGEDLFLRDTIADPRDEIAEAEERLQREQMAAAVWAVVDELNEAEREVLRARYKDSLPLQDTAERLGISIDRVHQIQQRALQRLRRGKLRRQLEAYAEEIGSVAYNGKLGIFLATGSSSTELAFLRKERREEALLKGML